jgi:hypothetical protein
MSHRFVISSEDPAVVQQMQVAVVYPKYSGMRPRQAFEGEVANGGQHGVAIHPPVARVLVVVALPHEILRKGLWCDRPLEPLIVEERDGDPRRGARCILQDAMRGGAEVPPAKNLGLLA